MEGRGISMREREIELTLLGYTQVLDISPAETMLTLKIRLIRKGTTVNMKTVYIQLDKIDIVDMRVRHD